MSKEKVTSLFGLILTVFILSSCAAPTYLPRPDIMYPKISNKGTFNIQNMDNNAKVESNNLTCHYDGFDVVYRISNDFVVSFDIVNNTNKSLIIDKSKSYVLYSGYSSQLFKDVRSSRSTTFNNVQDAINNVQTNEAGVSMTIPPYSKWQLPLQETNVREIKTLPDFNTVVGRHSLTPYDNKETVEFVIPYSFDYSMAKWETCRNRIYVGSIETNAYSDIYGDANYPKMISNCDYQIIRSNGAPDYSEANRVDAINRQRFKKHNRAVTASRITWGIITLPTTLGIWLLLWPHCVNHEPPVYGNGGNAYYSPTQNQSSTNNLGQVQEDPFGGFFK